MVDPHSHGEKQPDPRKRNADPPPCKIGYFMAPLSLEDAIFLELFYI